MFFNASALPSSIQKLTNNARNKMFDELARTIIAMVKSQIFREGNHRAAVLTLMDYLAVLGIQYKADPVILYLELTPATWRQTDRVRLAKKISKLLSNSVEKKSMRSTPEVRAAYAGRIKTADMIHNWRRHAEYRREQANDVREKAQIKLQAAIKEATAAQAVVSRAAKWGEDLKRVAAPKKDNKWQADFMSLDALMKAPLV